MSLLTPFLSLPSLTAVLIVSFLLSLGINIAYKYLTDQKLMKRLKEEISDIQKNARGMPPEKAMGMQKKAFEVNMEYLKHSLKPTLFTMIPVLLIFLWMGAHYAYVPLHPDTIFSTTIVLEPGTIGEAEILPQQGIEIVGENKKTFNNGTVSFTLKGEEGNYLIEYLVSGQKYNKEVLITQEQSYAASSEKLAGNVEIKIDYQKNELLNIFGWRMGWLATYIISSLIFSIALRKIMNLY